MKKILCVAAVLLSVASAFSAGAKDSRGSGKPVVIGTLNGPSGIPSARLMDTMTELKGHEVRYEAFAAANQLLPKLLSGEVDVGFLPPNVAAKAFTASNGALVNVGVAGNGMLSLITKDAAVTSVQDLRGKTVAVAGAGATPEYVFRYVLQKNGVSVGTGADSVTLDFSIPNNELAAAVISGKVACAVVPEPFSTVATTQDATVRRAIDLQAEFAKASGVSDYPMTLIVARAAFARENADLLVALQKKYDEAQKWTKKNPAAAGEATERAGLGLKAAVVQKAIPTANFTYQSAVASRPSVEALLSVFLQFAPESIGGKLPSDGFYFSK